MSKKPAVTYPYKLGVYNRNLHPNFNDLAGPSYAAGPEWNAWQQLMQKISINSDIYKEPVLLEEIKHFNTFALWYQANDYPDILAMLSNNPKTILACGYPVVSNKGFTPRETAV